MGGKSTETREMKFATSTDDEGTVSERDVYMKMNGDDEASKTEDGAKQEKGPGVRGSYEGREKVRMRWGSGL